MKKKIFMLFEGQEQCPHYAAKTYASNAFSLFSMSHFYSLRASSFLSFDSIFFSSTAILAVVLLLSLAGDASVEECDACGHPGPGLRNFDEGAAGTSTAKPAES